MQGGSSTGLQAVTFIGLLHHVQTKLKAARGDEEMGEGSLSELENLGPLNFSMQLSPS